MTGSRKKLWLSLFWGGLLVLIAGASALLVFAMREYVDARERLTEGESGLEALYKMAPFPSEDNVELEKHNLDTLRKALNELQGALSRNQVEPAELKQPTVFMESFWQAQKEILAQARTAGVALPPDFGFGLETYLRGQPPKPDHVPRLMQQLTLIKAFCDLLFQAKVSAIDAVARESFEDAEAGAEADDAASAAVVYAGRRGGRRPGDAAAATDSRSALTMVNGATGLIPPDALFGKMKFVLVFKAKEDNVVDVLNRLAALPMFVVVTRVDWVAPKDQVQIRKKLIQQDQGGSAVPAEGQGKESRVVSGKESALTVRIDLDVYRFTRKAE